MARRRATSCATCASTAIRTARARIRRRRTMRTSSSSRWSTTTCASGPIIFSDLHRGEAMRKSLGMSPQEVIRASRLPSARPWRRGLPRRHEVGVHARRARREASYVICNADEGEPGTFKDRVLLTEIPDRLFAGMTIAGYAIGAAQGILYLRAEYAYLRPLSRGSARTIAARRAARQGRLGARRASTSTSASRWAPAPTSAVRRPR
jgi:NADH:ubiquinone oxidoreductase subunit F (NADH-binding)